MPPLELEPSPAFEPDRPGPPPNADEPYITKNPTIALVKETVHPLTWEDERCSFDVLRDLLNIVNEPVVLDEVEAALRRVERARAVSILVRTQLLEASDEPTAHAMVDLTGDLTADQRAAVRAQLAPGKAAVRADRTVTVMPGNSAQGLAGERRAYVEGYAARDGALVPTVGRVRSGLRLVVCADPMPGEDRAAVAVELHDEALEMGEDPKLDDGARLQRPALRQLHRKARVTVANGGAALVDLGDRRFLLVEVRISHAP